jgi:exoribonuclease II
MQKVINSLIKGESLVYAPAVAANVLNDEAGMQLYNVFLMMDQVTADCTN